MDVEMKPAVWNVLWAQGVAYLLVAILTTILLAILFFLMATMGPAWYLMIVFPFSGFILARLQQRMLRKRFPKNRIFLLASAGALFVLLFGEYFLFTRFIIDEKLVHSLTAFGGMTAWHAVQPVITRWSILSGFLAGLPGGLLFGLIQSIFLPWHRRLWWASSALAWGLLGAILLDVVNGLIFVIYLALPHV